MQVDIVVVGEYKLDTTQRISTPGALAHTHGAVGKPGQSFGCDINFFAIAPYDFIIAALEIAGIAL